MNKLDSISLLLGRVLLGLYFIVPGISKLANYSGTTEYMAQHNVPLIGVLLPLTILMQIGLGGALVVGYRGKLAALFLAVLTLLISVYMHNFWTYEVGMEKAHEMQNFIKNMAIMGGLLVISAIGTGRMSLRN